MRMYNKRSRNKSKWNLLVVCSRVGTEKKFENNNWRRISYRYEFADIKEDKITDVLVK